MRQIIPHKFETKEKTPFSVLEKLIQVKKIFSPSVKKNFTIAMPI